ncbi:beta-propeller fold lactonase family protein [Scandinavium sp. M-37]|uniref:beta-propeller fold lactonase family protein n=1 Tax=Scandinavium sp. M-37 TaxID=3373077 RepID=UPI00374719BA
MKWYLWSVIAGCSLFSNIVSAAENDIQRSFSGHHIYVNANDKLNKVIHYIQLKNGSLLEVSRISTRGEGTGGYKPLTMSVSSADALVSASAITMSTDHKWLFVVNAGDNSVSSFSVDESGDLHLVDNKSTESSGVSSTLSYNDEKSVLYVGDTFGPDHIRTFSVKNGALKLKSGAQSINTDSMNDRILTQIQVSPDNRYLLANVLYDKRPEKINGKFTLFPANKTTKNGIAVFPVLEDGSPGTPLFYDADGETPFGLTFIPGGDGRFVNTLDQAPGIAVLGKLNGDGTITNLSRAEAKVNVPGKDAIGSCWVSMSPDGKVAFVAGFDTGDVTSFTVKSDTLTYSKGGQGKLEKSDLSNDPKAVATGSPVGNWVSSNGYFYQLYPSAAKLVAYRIDSDSLRRIESYQIPLNSPQGITGF